MSQKPNDRCACGSGKKFKKCCMNKTQQDLAFEKYLREFKEMTAGYKPEIALLCVAKASYRLLGHQGRGSQPNGAPIPGTDFSEIAKYLILGADSNGKAMTPDEYIACEKKVIHAPRKRFLDDFDRGKANLTLVRMGFFQFKYNAQAMEMVGRSAMLYQYFKELKADESKINLNEVFQTHIGMTPALYMAIGANILFSLKAFDAQINKSYLLNQKSDMKHLLTHENFEKFLQECAATPQQFKDESAKWELPDDIKEYEFNSLMTYPIIRTSSDINGEDYIAPFAYLLLYKFTTGIFHTLLNKYGWNTPESKQFRDNFGKNILEPYITRHLRECIPKRNLWPSWPISDSPSADRDGEIDHLFCEGGHWFVIEATTASASIPVQQVNPESKFDDYIKSLSHKVDQLFHKHELFLSNDKRLPNKYMKGQPHHSILVTLEELPFPNILIRHFLELERTRENKPSFDYHLINLSDLEFLCQVGKRVSMAKIFSRKEKMIPNFDIKNARQVSQFLVAKRMGVSASTQKFDNPEIPDWTDSMYSDMKDFLMAYFVKGRMPHYSKLLQMYYYRLFEEAGVKSHKNYFIRLKRKYVLRIKNWMKGY